MEIVTSPRVSPQDEWFIAHNNVDVFVTAFNLANTSIYTGQPILEVTSDLEDYLQRCEELNITPQIDE